MKKAAQKKMKAKVKELPNFGGAGKFPPSKGKAPKAKGGKW